MFKILIVIPQNTHTQKQPAKKNKTSQNPNPNNNENKITWVWVLKGVEVKECLPICHGSRTFEVTALTWEDEEYEALSWEGNDRGQGKARPAVRQEAATS